MEFETKVQKSCQLHSFQINVDASFLTRLHHVLVLVSDGIATAFQDALSQDTLNLILSLYHAVTLYD